MRILALGAGAVGGYFGGRLAEASGDVTFLVRLPRAAALAERGLTVSSPLSDFHVSVKVTTANRLEGPYDLIILAAKQYDLDAAIAAIGPAVGPQTTILPLLNGLVHLDRLDGTFGLVNVLGDVAYIGASLAATAASDTTTGCPALPSASVVAAKATACGRSPRNSPAPGQRAR
jgi:2-dehydropantoate 2-reductase